MKVTVERMPESQVLLDIAAEDDEFNQAMEKAYRTVSRQVQLPGFRKGHVPRTMIERMLGREVFLEEANKNLMEDLYRRAVEQEEIVPVGDPSVELVNQEPLSFKVTIPVFPTVEVGAYTDVRIEPEDATVSDEEVDEVLTRLQRAQSPWADPAEPRSPQDGDQVTIDLEVKDGDEQFQEPMTNGIFIVGESNLFEGITEQLKQMQVGDTRTFDLDFAEDDETVNERIRGKHLTYTVTLTGLKERQLLPLDDEFAKTVADADTVEDLRREIREDLHQGKTSEARTKVLNQIVEKMAEGSTIDVPHVMVHEAIHDEINQLRGRLAQQRTSLEDYLRANNQTEAELEEEMEPQAATRLRNSLLLREIAKLEGIEVTEADVTGEVDNLIAASRSEDKTQLRSFYESDYFQRILRNDLFERRVTDRLIEVATEGRGAVVNPWTPPAVTEGAEEAETAEETTEALAAEAESVDASAAESAPVETVAESDAQAEAKAED